MAPDGASRGERADADAVVATAAPESDSRSEGGAAPPTEDGEPSWPDAAAESSFLAEARERGEPPATPKPEALVEETDQKSLPPLDELVKRIPPEIRETLDELFRARFVTVRRVPKRALKQ